MTQAEYTKLIEQRVVSRCQSLSAVLILCYSVSHRSRRQVDIAAAWKNKERVQALKQAITVCRFDLVLDTMLHFLKLLCIFVFLFC